MTLLTSRTLGAARFPDQGLSSEQCQHGWTGHSSGSTETSLVRFIAKFASSALREKEKYFASPQMFPWSCGRSLPVSLSLSLWSPGRIWSICIT